ncbi:Nucleolar transcription factor 1-B [Trichoplax sp. H2]|nr:Nucleolar transcription factor 1-B [Trichoplax sp. H2]|eukprot:RDD38366.1 Nucleolar transcription factor 1-B [Trichoplax sp. H2]
MAGIDRQGSKTTGKAKKRQSSKSNDEETNLVIAEDKKRKKTVEKAKKRKRRTTDEAEVKGAKKVRITKSNRKGDADAEGKKKRKKKKKKKKKSKEKKSKKRLSDSKAALHSNEGNESSQGESLSGAAGSDDEDGWSGKTYEKLFERLATLTPLNMPYNGKINWDEIAWNNHSGEDLMEKWKKLTKNMRKTRSVHEMVNAIKGTGSDYWENCQHDLPKKPLNAYLQFYAERRKKLIGKQSKITSVEASKKISEVWRNLPDKKKKKYQEKYLEDEKVYKETLAKLGVSTAKGPKKSRKTIPPKRKKKIRPPRSPYHCFLRVRLNELKEEGKSLKESRLIISEEWKNLSDEQTIEWKKASNFDLARYQNEIKEMRKSEPNFRLTDKEKSTSKYRPIVKHPPATSYNIFVGDFYKKNNVKGKSFSDIGVTLREKWNNLSTEEKTYYEQELQKRKQEYETNLREFLQTVPENERDKTEKMERQLRVKKDKGKNKMAVLMQEMLSCVPEDKRQDFKEQLEGMGRTKNST